MQTNQDTHQTPGPSRLRLAELSSAVGAGVLGLGAGLLLQDVAAFEGAGLPVLVVGLLLHAWGMTDKHRLEADAPRPAWSTALYWICWALLAALGLYLLVRAVGGAS